jgi:hypothetical protein
MGQAKPAKKKKRDKKKVQASGECESLHFPYFERSQALAASPSGRGTFERG